MKVSKKKYFAKGKRGITYTALYGSRKILIKEANPRSDVNTIRYESGILKKVNKKGIGPEFIALHNGALFQEFIEGKSVECWIDEASKVEIKKFLIDILQQCRTLDLLKISKKEMTRPYKHILVTKKGPVQIDFDRAQTTEKPKNVTQICQWMTSSRFGAELRKKDILLDKKLIVKYAKAYKEDYSNASYNLIIKVLEDA